MIFNKSFQIPETSFLLMLIMCHLFLETKFIQQFSRDSLLPHQTPRIPNSSSYCYYYSLSQKPSHGDISGTKRGIIDPLVSKRPEKILNKKIQKEKKKRRKNVRNGQK